MCLISEEIYCPDEGERPMLMYEITANDNAICNDGTKAEIHYRESLPGENENKWVFRFEGGDMCHSTVTMLMYMHTSI